MKTGRTTEDGWHGSWRKDAMKGLLYALLILLAILFYSGAASKFIYVDF